MSSRIGSTSSSRTGGGWRGRRPRWPGRCRGCDRAWRRRSGSVTGRSLAASASRSVAPMTWPVRIPPPASRAQATCGQWSRPASLLIFGVRPNSPQTTTDTSLSRPRACRSSTRAERPWSSFGRCVAALAEVVPVAVPAAEGERHAADAGLDQPAGHQELVVAAGAAVVDVLHVAVAVLGPQPRVFPASGRAPRPAALEVRMSKARRREGVHARRSRRWRRCRGGGGRGSRAGPCGRRGGSSVTPLERSCSPGPRPLGVNGACARPEEARARRGSAQGACPIAGERPTNGGTDGSTGPCSFESDRAEARPAPCWRLCCVG